MENTKELIFANEMADQLFKMRCEENFDILATESQHDVPEEFAEKIINDESHIAAMKKIISNTIHTDVINRPADFIVGVENGQPMYGYSSLMYDYAYHIDTYIEDLYEEERKSKLKVTYKVWIEIERCETNTETGEEEFFDEECPIGIALRDTFEEAVNVQEEIERHFGEIPVI